MVESKTGQCLCGSVNFEASGPFRPVCACHCRQCAQWSGNYVTATSVSEENLNIADETDLTWYQSSQDAKRGFCRKCGSSLFWKNRHRESISIMAGVLDTPTGLSTSDHIYVADKSDYYEICDNVAQHKQTR